MEVIRTRIIFAMSRRLGLAPEADGCCFYLDEKKKGKEKKKANMLFRHKWRYIVPMKQLHPKYWSFKGNKRMSNFFSSSPAAIYHLLWVSAFSSCCLSLQIRHETKESKKIKGKDIRYFFLLFNQAVVFIFHFSFFFPASKVLAPAPPPHTHTLILKALK